MSCWGWMKTSHSKLMLNDDDRCHLTVNDFYKITETTSTQLVIYKLLECSLNIPSGLLRWQTDRKWRKKQRKKENVTENSNRPNVYSKIFIKRAGFLFTVRSKTKNKTQKKTMHDSFPVLVVESIPFLNFKDEWLWVSVVPFPCVLLLMYDLFLGCLCIVQYKLVLVIH